MLNLLFRQRKLVVLVYSVLYFFAFCLTFGVSWVRNLGNVARQELIFFLVYAVGLIWLIAILLTFSYEARRKNSA